MWRYMDIKHVTAFESLELGGTAIAQQRDCALVSNEGRSSSHFSKQSRGATISTFFPTFLWPWVVQLCCALRSICVAVIKTEMRKQRMGEEGLSRLYLCWRGRQHPFSDQLGCRLQGLLLVLSFPVQSKLCSIHFKDPSQFPGATQASQCTREK